MRQDLITQYFNAAQVTAIPDALEAVLVMARRELSEEEYATLLGRLLSHPAEPDESGESRHGGEMYRIRLDYQALLPGGPTVVRSWQADTLAINAVSALAYALSGFRQEISSQGYLLKVWGVKAQVELSDEILRQSLEALVPGGEE